MKKKKRKYHQLIFLKSVLKDINSIEIAKEKSGSYKIKYEKNLYYLCDGVRKPFLIDWDEINKKNINIKRLQIVKKAIELDLKSCKINFFYKYLFKIPCYLSAE